MMRNKIIFIGMTATLMMVLIICLLFWPWQINLPQEYCQKWIFDADLTERITTKKLDLNVQLRLKDTSISFESDGKIIAFFRLYSDKENLYEVVHHYKIVGKQDDIFILHLETPDLKDSKNRTVGVLKTIMYLKLLSPEELLIQNHPILHGKIPLPESQYWSGYIKN